MTSDDARGTYRHYKGGMYQVLGIARHSETEEELVVYSSASGEWWVRPREMFFSSVVVDGTQQQRFTRVRTADVRTAEE